MSYNITHREGVGRVDGDLAGTGRVMIAIVRDGCISDGLSVRDIAGLCDANARRGLKYDRAVFDCVLRWVELEHPLQRTQFHRIFFNGAVGKSSLEPDQALFVIKTARLRRNKIVLFRIVVEIDLKGVNRTDLYFCGSSFLAVDDPGAGQLLLAAHAVNAVIRQLQNAIFVFPHRRYRYFCRRRRFRHAQYECGALRVIPGKLLRPFPIAVMRIHAKPVELIPFAAGMIADRF